jgi:diacylglycerol kinase family enzyme
VANGLLRAGRPDVVFGVWPLGSANDYAHSLGVGSLSALGRGADLGVRQVDVGWVRREDGRERYFVNTLGLGFSGAVALESRRIRRLQGLWLYGLAFFRALYYRYACPVMTVTLDQHARQVPTFSLTVAIGRREGNFVVAPQARLDDGLFDYVHAGPLSRWEVLRYLPRLASGGQLPSDHPALWLGRCQEVRLRSEAPLTVHLDGEFFSRPEDGVRGLDVRILPGVLRVQGAPGFRAPGPNGPG